MENKNYDTDCTGVEQRSTHAMNETLYRRDMRCHIPTHSNFFGKYLTLTAFAILLAIGNINAQSGACGENLEWVLNGNTLTISGTGEMYGNYTYGEDNRPPWYNNRDTPGWRDFSNIVAENVGQTNLFPDEDFIFVQGGTFLMGAQRTDIYGANYDIEANPGENPVHQVSLDNFWIEKYEVTQKQWFAIMGYNFIYHRGEGDNYPVYRASWNEIQNFISMLNALQTQYTYRLPTEAEWEYAARGGNQTAGNKYSGSNNINDIAWYSGNSYDLGRRHPDFGVHPVGTKLPNELGIYDMTGNVMEWCSDWEDGYSGDAQTNPAGPVSPPGGNSSLRVIRGGDWTLSARGCRNAARYGDYPFSEGKATEDGTCGFRLVRSVSGTGTAIEKVKNTDLKIYVSGDKLQTDIPFLGKMEYPDGIQIYDVSGRNVIATRENIINISALPAGVYIVKAGRKSGKFVKR